MKQPFVRKQGEGEVLSVLGSALEFICGGERTGSAWSLIECRAPRDVGPPPHHHAWDEAYYVLAGQIRFSLDGRELIIAAGDFVYVPGGTVHAFAGATDDARLLIFDAPAHAEAFFRETSREVRELPRDVPKVPAIGERHGIHFLPPAH
jgi:mannose-6-phosphate isomerase-like protein (cupin superfamily)